MFVDFGSMPQDNLLNQQQLTQVFQAGLADQKNKNWDDAISKYQSLLDQSHGVLTSEQASVIYHNLSLSAFAKAEFLKSYIWSKKSITLDPGNDIANSFFQEVIKKFQPMPVARQISATDGLQKAVIRNTPFDFLFVTLLIFSCFTLYVGLKFWLLRHRNQLEAESTSIQKKNPLGLLIGFLSLTGLSGILLVVVILKWQDLQIPKALTLTEKTEVQTGTGGGQAVIYEAPAGLEVDVLKIEPEYVQIRHPGAFSGWVKKQNIEIISEPYWP